MGGFGINGNYNLKIDGTLKQLQDEIRTVYASVPDSMKGRLNFDISILSSLDYTNPYAVNQLGAILSNLMFQKRTLGSVDEYKQSKHLERLEAEQRWEAQRDLCYKLSVKIGGMNKDEDPDAYAAAEKELAEAEFYRDEIYGPAMVDAVTSDNNLNMLG